MRISDWSSDVCSSDLIVRACAVARPEGDANARADRQLVAVDLVSIRKPVDQPFAKLDHRLVVVRLAHDDGEFVAAKTADAVAVVGRLLDPVGDFAKKLVADLMAQRVVDRRSEERRVGKEWVSPCRSRWAPVH